MLSYRIEGRGNPLLLIHGWGVTYNVWQKLIPLLAPHFQLILVELPGMSAAPPVLPGKPYYEFCAEKLEEFRVALGIKRWAILAYSTGTRVSEAYMQHYGQRVSRAVFLCPIYLTRPWMMAIQVGQWLNPKNSQLASWFLSGWRLYGWLLTVGFNLRGRDYASAWMREIEERPLDNLKEMFFALPGKGRAPFTLPTVPSVPTLFVWGQHDALTARPTHLRSNDVFIAANHGAPVLTPDRVAEVVVPFLREELTLPPHKRESDKQIRFHLRLSKLLSQVGRSKAWSKL